MTLSADTTICQGSKAWLIAGGGISYAWDHGPEEDNIAVSPDTTTLYTVTVTDGNGCMASDSVTVEVTPLPQIPVVTPDGPLTFCTGDSVVLASDYAEDILWSTGDTTQAITVFSSGAYFVTYTSPGTSCAVVSLPDTVEVLPEPYISMDNPEPCAGDTVILTLNHGSDYNWSTAENSQSIAVNPVDTTVYFVNGINAPRLPLHRFVDDHAASATRCIAKCRHDPVQRQRSPR